MSLLRPGVIKQHKPDQNILKRENGCFKETVLLWWKKTPPWIGHVRHIDNSGKYINWRDKIGQDS